MHKFVLGAAILAACGTALANTACDGRNMCKAVAADPKDPTTLPHVADCSLPLPGQPNSPPRPPTPPTVVLPPHEYNDFYFRQYPPPPPPPRRGSADSGSSASSCTTVSSFSTCASSECSMCNDIRTVRKAAAKDRPKRRHAQSFEA
ncbi:hypothetical protein ANO11243_093880 [Dothideomycetidae sp. 11243]|nr:hypothetical protein ANO11243_093880 [fungal sp. No.11243]